MCKTNNELMKRCNKLGIQTIECEYKRMKIIETYVYFWINKIYFIDGTECEFYTSDAIGIDEAFITKLENDNKEK